MSTFHLPEIVANTSGVRIISNVGQFQARSGYIQTDARGGERLAMNLSYNFKQTAERRRLIAIFAWLNGRQHRLAARDFAYAGPAGAISVSELQPALQIANYSNTTWLDEVNLDDGIRLRRVQNDTNGHAYLPTVNPTTVAGLSYSVKSALVSYGTSRGRSLYASSASGAGDLLDSGSVPHVTGVDVGAAFSAGTTVRFGPTDNWQSGDPASNQWDYTHTSMARCLLVDNGANFLTNSSELNAAAWTLTNATITQDQADNWDAAATMDELVETTANGFHQVEQTYTRTAAQEFWTATVFVRENTQRRIQLNLEDGSANGWFGIFDSNTGTVVSNGVAGSGADNGYASIHDYGNGLYRCRVTVRLPSTTSVRVNVQLVDGVTSSPFYTGDGTSGIYLGGAQAIPGTQPGRPVETDGSPAAVNSGSAQKGGSIFVKAGDASTDGLLLPGDQIELNGQLCVVQSALDGDASGCGLLNVLPRIRLDTTDEDPVVLERPEGRFLLASPVSGWTNQPGVFSAFQLDLIEDIAA